MLYRFPYQKVKPVEIPDANLIGVYQAPTIILDGSERETIAKGFTNPIGAPRLRDAVKRGQRVLILCDDNTRETPAHLILPFLLDELQASGVADENVQILMALGTHREMTAQELEDKLGPDAVERYPVTNHHWDDDDSLVYHGTTSSGLEIHINKKMRWADFVIGLGCIFPHAVAGFSGGGKIVVPGICGEATSGDMHWMMHGIPPTEIYGHADNPVRRIIDEVALEAGLNYLVDCVLDADGKVVALVTGHPVAAHRAGCDISRRVHSVAVPCQADIVLFDSYRTDLDYWQAIKAITPAGIVMKEGGIVIQIAQCPEGVSASHPEVLEFGYRPLVVIEELLRVGAVNKSVAAHMIQASEVIIERGRGFLVSPHISFVDTARLGFLYASNAQDALDRALDIKGPDATIIVLRQAGDLLPVIANDAS
ncbi:MAG: nickel-dependent lactate racemase [Chloroflexota bacterium]